MSAKVATAVQREACTKTVCPCKAKCQAFRAEVIKRTIQNHKDIEAAKKAVYLAKKKAEINGDLYAEADPKLIVAIRIRGINGVSPKIRKILKLLRLRQINNAVFIKANASTIKMLRLVDPYVTYGYPTLETVQKLIYKRGALKINGNRMPITSNCMIKKTLGDKDIICADDLIHEIYTVGKHFKEVNNKLAPFKLNGAKIAEKNKKIHFILGGGFGNRELLINKLLAKMI
uniref:60S ribosomal protein L7, putative n=1 Tax=Entamoeba histolytica TaxID=5759 RepID=S0AYD9_ENTHI|nr:60S ribosomal protein L7, putative [Entamoeba histolytica]